MADHDDQIIKFIGFAQLGELTEMRALMRRYNLDVNVSYGMLCHLAYFWRFYLLLSNPNPCYFNNTAYTNDIVLTLLAIYRCVWNDGINSSN